MIPSVENHRDAWPRASLSRAVRTASFRGDITSYTKLLIYVVLFAVPQYGVSIHANIQPDLHDVINRPLVRLSSVSRSYAPRISTKFMGCDKWTTGWYFHIYNINKYVKCLVLSDQSDTAALHQLTSSNSYIALHRLSYVTGP